MAARSADCEYVADGGVTAPAADVLPEGRAAITDIGLFLHDRLFGGERSSGRTR